MANKVCFTLGRFLLITVLVFQLIHPGRSETAPYCRPATCSVSSFPGLLYYSSPLSYLIDGSTYKTNVLTNGSATAAAGYLANSAWFMIDQGSSKTVITVNVNEYAMDTWIQRRFGTSHICIGNNSAGPLATGNSCSPAFFSGGFKKLPDLLPGLNTGRYVFVYRAGDGNGGNYY